MDISSGTILFVSAIAILLGITVLGAAAYTADNDIYPFQDGGFGMHGMHGSEGMHGGNGYGEHCGGEEAGDCDRYNEEYCEEHEEHGEDCPYYDED